MMFGKEISVKAQKARTVPLGQGVEKGLAPTVRRHAGAALKHQPDGGGLGFRVRLKV